MGINVLLLSFAAVLASEGFVPVTEDKGVKVWRHEIPQGFELAAEGDIAATPDEVLALLSDYAGSPAWVDHLAVSKVLSREPDGLVVYQRLDLPIISNRDYTLRVRWGSDGTARWLKFTTDNAAGPPPVEGVVRISTHEGSWRLEPTADGRGTHASYRVHLDIAGSLPGWMGKGRAAKDVPKLFERMRARLQKH